MSCGADECAWRNLNTGRVANIDPFHYEDYAEADVMERLLHYEWTGIALWPKPQPGVEIRRFEPGEEVPGYPVPKADFWPR